MTAIILVLGILAFMANAGAAPWQICGKRDYYKANSKYHDNLDILSNALPHNASSAPSLFAKGSVGSGQVIIYGLALCRGDTNVQSCNDCVGTAFLEARLQCSSDKDATIFFEACLVRFSNKDFFANFNASMTDHLLMLVNAENSTGHIPGWDPKNFKMVDAITEVVMGLLQMTAQHAAYNSTRMYAT